MGIVLDSTALIGAERSDRSVLELLTLLRDRFGDQEVAISVIAAHELLHGVWRANSPKIRAQREEFVEEVLHRVPLWPVTLTVVRIAARIDAQARLTGSAIPLSDLLIGATALDLDFAVVTGNLRHFAKIPSLIIHEFG